MMFLKDRELAYPPFRSPGRVNVTPDGTKIPMVFSAIVDRLVFFLETICLIPEMLSNIPNPMVVEYAAHQKSQVSPKGFNRFLDLAGHAPVVGHNVEYEARPSRFLRSVRAFFA